MFVGESEQPIINIADPVRIAMANRVKKETELFITASTWPCPQGPEDTNLAKRGHEIPLGQAQTLQIGLFCRGQNKWKKPDFFVEIEILFVKFPRLVLADVSQKASE